MYRGAKTKPILPLTEAGPAALEPQERDWDILLTAETHNFPCAVAPYPGAPSFTTTAPSLCHQDLDPTCKRPSVNTLDPINITGALDASSRSSVLTS